MLIFKKLSISDITGTDRFLNYVSQFSRKTTPKEGTFPEPQKNQYTAGLTNKRLFSLYTLPFMKMIHIFTDQHKKLIGTRRQPLQNRHIFT